MPPAQPQEAHDLIRFVVRHMVCNHCGLALHTENVDVVFHRDRQWVLRVSCDACGMTQSVSAFDELPYMRPWLSKHVEPSPISQGDLQAWRSFLAEFDGDMLDLLIS